MYSFEAKYPLIFKDITRLWGTPDGRKYLSELLRRAKIYNPTRIAYSKEDIAAITELLAKHDKTYPELDDTYEYVKETFTSSNRTPLQRELPPKKEEGSHFATKLLIIVAACFIAAYYLKTYKFH